MSALEGTVAAPPDRRRWVASVRGTDPILVFSAVVCFLLALMAIFGPLLAPYSSSQISLLHANEGSSSAHILGTDYLGRDIWSRILVGARMSLLGPLVVVLVSAVAGTALGISGVWMRGAFEQISVRLIDVMFAFPSLLFAVIAVAVFGEGFVAPVIALSIAYIPYIARVVRSIARRERDLPYVDACVVGGLSGWKICARHIFPNVWPIVLAQATIAFSSALIDLSSISFIGLGTQPPEVDWGLMVSEGTTPLLNGYPRECMTAGVMVLITVVAFNVLGERLARRASPTR